jgi:ADP-heptose:LPS heptosyltransferase
VDTFLDMAKVDAQVLAGLKADVAILLFPERKLAQMLAKAGIRKRIGTSHRWYNWLYCTDRVSFSRSNSDLHEAQLNTKLLKPLGFDGAYSLEFLAGKYGFRKPVLQKEFEYLLDDAEVFTLIIHPKSRGSAREWPLANYLQLVKRLSGKSVRIIITGTEAEGELIQAECAALFEQSNVFNATGKLNLEQLIALISRADGLLACSTGPLHIGAMAGIYALGLYPAKRPMHPGRWAPIGTNAHFLVKGVACNSCDVAGQCACLMAIEVGQVYEQIMLEVERMKG